MNVDEAKRRLAALAKENIRFNEPHFTNQLLLREGKHSEVLEHITQPTALVKVVSQPSKYGDTKHALHFATNDKTIILPVIFDDKGLYILTYIKRHRRTT